MNREMQRALEADGEKLRQLTGEDHGPYFDGASDLPPLPAEKWTPEQRGRALHFIIVLANTPPNDWRSKKEIHEALAEFRSPQATVGPDNG